MNSEDLTGITMKESTGQPTYDHHNHEPGHDRNVSVLETDGRENGEDEEEDPVEGVHVVRVTVFVALQQVNHWSYSSHPRSS